MSEPKLRERPTQPTQGFFFGLVFLTVPVGAVWSIWWSMQHGIWLPDNLSTYGGSTDQLFNWILWTTGIVFILTQACLCWFVFRYRDDGSGKSRHIHTHHTVEMVWTAIPAAILVILALVQMRAWAHIKINMPDVPPLAEVTAGQFEWRVRYPGPDGELGTLDDIHDLNELHVPIGRPTLIRLRSRDVIHSFFVPLLRVKQDAVPGITIPVWFEPTETTAAARERIRTQTLEARAVDGMLVSYFTATDAQDCRLVPGLAGLLAREELRAGDEAILSPGQPIGERDIARLRRAGYDRVLAGVLPADHRIEETDLAQLRAAGALSVDSYRQFDYELVCAELCGWGHYKMRGRLTVETEEEFQATLERLTAAQMEIE